MDESRVKHMNLMTETTDTGVRRKAVNTERMTATRYSFPPGGKFEEHVHPQEQIGFLIAGELSFDVEGEHFSMQAGDMILIASGERHSAIAGPDGAEALSIVSPPRG